jgi:hypothetical protein
MPWNSAHRLMRARALSAQLQAAPRAIASSYIAMPSAARSPDARSMPSSLRGDALAGVGSGPSAAGLAGRRALGAVPTGKGGLAVAEGRRHVMSTHPPRRGTVVAFTKVAASAGPSRSRNE